MTQNQNLKSTVFANTEKFHNAEQMWFWFIYSRSVQSGIMRKNINSARRPCELLDVETLITKLYLAGRLDDAQLAIMKEFGDKRRAPHQYIWAENRAADLWRRAMATLEQAAHECGWIE